MQLQPDVPKLSLLSDLKEKTQTDFTEPTDLPINVPLASALGRVKRMVREAEEVKKSLAQEIEQLQDVKKVSKTELEQSLKVLYSVKKKTISEVGVHTRALQTLKDREQEIVQAQNDYLDEIDNEIKGKRKGIVETASRKEKRLQRTIAYLQAKEKVLAETYALIVQIHENLVARSSEDELERLQIEKRTKDAIGLEKDLLVRSERLSEALAEAESDRSDTNRLKQEAQKQHQKALEERERGTKEIASKQRVLERTENVLMSLQEHLEKKGKQQQAETRRLKDWSDTLQAVAKEIEERKKTG